MVKENTKVGRLLVIEKSHKKNRCWFWKCRCDCGNYKIIKTTSLNIENKYFTRSCGCLNKEINQKNNLIDLKGKNFDKLVVLKKHKRSRNNSFTWLCKCECGKIKAIRGDSLRDKKTTSCGCIGTSRLAQGESAFNKLYSSYKARSKRKNREFLLNKEDFRFLTKQNCQYCGNKPKQKQFNRTYKGIYLYNGIDRRDNLQGYTKENSISCCKTCNFAKHRMTEKEFKNWIRRLIKFYAK